MICKKGKCRPYDPTKDKVGGSDVFFFEILRYSTVRDMVTVSASFSVSAGAVDPGGEGEDSAGGETAGKDR